MQTKQETRSLKAALKVRELDTRRSSSLFLFLGKQRLNMYEITLIENWQVLNENTAPALISLCNKSDVLEESVEV